MHHSSCVLYDNHGITSVGRECEEVYHTEKSSAKRVLERVTANDVGDFTSLVRLSEVERARMKRALAVVLTDAQVKRLSCRPGFIMQEAAVENIVNVIIPNPENSTEAMTIKSEAADAVAITVKSEAADAVAITVKSEAADAEAITVKEEPIDWDYEPQVSSRPVSCILAPKREADEVCVRPLSEYEQVEKLKEGSFGASVTNSVERKTSEQKTDWLQSDVLGTSRDVEVKHVELSRVNAVTSLEVRKLIVKLRNKDKLSIGTISKTVGKSKSVVHSILANYEKTGSCEAKRSPGRPRKTSKREDGWLMRQAKTGRFATATGLSREADNKLGISISRHTVSRRLNENNLSRSRTFQKALHILEKQKG
ncbi:Transposase Tc1-like [Trinorchestia longiramus]|nr:Transposase Tc1-like [Trinorchestia longiramus]